MPATESTWRDTKLLHRIFAISGVVLTISTIWMFYKDHARSWKNYQVNTVNIDLKMTRMRQEQFETGDALALHQRLAAERDAALAAAVEPQLLGQFKSHLETLNKFLAEIADQGHAYAPIPFDARYVDATAKELEDLAADAQAKRGEARLAIEAAEQAAATPAADEAAKEQLDQLSAAARKADQAAAAAGKKAAGVRQELVGYLQERVDVARAHEDKASGIRKFKSADIDAAKANLDIAIRDNLSPEERQRRAERVQELTDDPKNGLKRLTEIYQSLSAGRKALENTHEQITAQADKAQTDYEDSLADLERLQKAFEQQEETYFSSSFPFLGKKILTLPILDAFSSPRKIENLWSEELEQQYGSFGNVRRFDRCTTCHQSLQKSLPGQPTTPAYVKQTEVDFVVLPPPKDAPPAPRRDKYGQPLELTLSDWLGLRLAREGLLAPDDATVDLVTPKSPAAKAQVLAAGVPAAPQTGLELREHFAQRTTPPASAQQAFPTLPGLMIGDVIVAINGDRLFGGNRGPKRVESMLIALAKEGEPLRLTIRRGFPNPYTSHPRLDLFLSDASPHPMQTFACTICHEGQGSGTDFKWASHTPNDLLEAERWRENYGWFDNHHWIYPMYPQRFAESACLKCHHEVVELEASESYPEAPASKVTHGYHLIRKYGCYGCHEVNGFDGPTKRVGPDLRSEPNYFAVAQQVQAELNRAQRDLTTARPAGSGESGEAPDQLSRLIEWKNTLEPLAAQVTAHPEDDSARDLLRQAIDDGVAAAGDQATTLDRQLAVLSNMLKDVEAPGDLRRPGPSLRYLASKVDRIFLYDWLNDPTHFRPNTRMPRFFGRFSHLTDHEGNVTDPHAPKLEPIEIRGIIEYIASYSGDQQFNFEQRPTGIDPWTDEEKIARGKQQFEVRGCLACHTHKDFPDVAKFRAPDEIVQGPDLSAVGLKFSQDRNPVGPDWLYSWIKNPTRYHARTLMPNVFLDLETIPGPDAMNPSEGAKSFDPADDITTYLLSASITDWEPIPEAATAAQPFPQDDSALKQLMLEHLNEAFYRDAAEEYFVTGIPPELEGELKGAEKDLIVHPGQKLTDAQRLKYIGRKTIAKYGCFGCHDIPGFEDAKPIGTGLADWGRKDPSRLAFEHISHYIEHGHGHAGPHGSHAKKTGDAMAHGQGGAGSETAVPATAAAVGHNIEDQRSADYYLHALQAGSRIGFIYQKLKEPRSYDFEKTENKRYNERLRMPQFSFNIHEREAIITFVLGLVAEPPPQKYLFQPDTRRAALIAGQQVLEKYNCGGCHILRGEKWNISYNPDDFGPQNPAKVFPYLRPYFSPQQLAEAAEPDAANRLHSTLFGLPTLDKNDGKPVLFDPDGLALENEAEYLPSEIGGLRYALELWRPTIIDGSPYMTGQSPVTVPAGQIDERYPVVGGTLTRYLLPVVTQIERRVNPNASGSEAYGWLPPPLMHEGEKVQPAWLHDFLLDPYPIRPAAFLRMPKFNMSSAEATALVDYFAAVDNATWPYTHSQTRQTSRLAEEEARYLAKLEEAGKVGEAPPPGSMWRLDDALDIVTDGNYCVKCHIVADYSPTGSNRAKAPNLANVYRRLRPEYARDWIANPKMFLPYTSMPVNIPYDPDLPNLGGVKQELYHGTSIEQVDAVVDLLMNYDLYTRESKKIADRVTPATPMEGTPPAETTGEAAGQNNATPAPPRTETP